MHGTCIVVIESNYHFRSLQRRNITYTILHYFPFNFTFHSVFWISSRASVFRTVAREGYLYHILSIYFCRGVRRSKCPLPWPSIARSLLRRVRHRSSRRASQRIPTRPPVRLTSKRGPSLLSNHSASPLSRGARGPSRSRATLTPAPTRPRRDSRPRVSRSPSMEALRGRPSPRRAGPLPVATRCADVRPCSRARREAGRGGGGI